MDEGKVSIPEATVGVILGHQKALFGTLVSPAVVILDWMQFFFTGYVLPQTIRDAIIALVTGIVVWRVPHGGAE